MEKITFTEKELEDVLHIKQRRIAELRKRGILNGVKIGKSYIYHNSEIKRFFERYEGKEIHFN